MSGKVLEADDFTCGARLGLSPLRADELIGKTLKRNMDVEDYFFDTDILRRLLKVENIPLAGLGVPSPLS